MGSIASGPMAAWTAIWAAAQAGGHGASVHWRSRHATRARYRRGACRVPRSGCDSTVHAADEVTVVRRTSCSMNRWQKRRHHHCRRSPGSSGAPSTAVTSTIGWRFSTRQSGNPGAPSRPWPPPRSHRTRPAGMVNPTFGQPDRPFRVQTVPVEAEARRIAARCGRCGFKLWQRRRGITLN